MARSSGGLTLLLALAILVAVPLGTMVWYRSWRARLMEPLTPLPTGTAVSAHPPAQADPVEEPPQAKLRPVDELLFRVFEGNGPPPGKDLLPDGPRVDLELAGANHIARVDLDRDGNWDEVWTIEPDALVRAVSPDDDGRNTQKYEWVVGNWAPLEAAE